jgi:subtilisin family serine protease
MSTEDTNKAVVTLHKGVDVDAFIEDMVSGKNHNEFMPNRPVELYNEKPDSLRNVDFVLTLEEANTLKNDPRIIDVRYGTKRENNIFLKPHVLEESRVYDKSITVDSSHYNWAFPACVAATNPYTTTTLNFQHAYSLSGKGVDVVIQDSGIDPNHPEWLNLEGTASRLQQVNWPGISGLTGLYTQGSSFYTDQEGHGTHCAGTVAGRRYGWAKEANIYSMKIFDTDAFSDTSSFNMIRAWHLSKPVSAVEGVKRPTVVNMSWGYFTTYANINGGTYRGTPWTGSSMVSAYGMIQTLYNRIGQSPNFSYTHGFRLASTEADITDCIDAGVILVGSAGNDAHKIDTSTGIDFNNSYNNPQVFGGPTVYYHRGSTPTSVPGVITVGSVKSANPEGKSFFSSCGPRVDVFAPGENIMSAAAIGSTDFEAGSVDYPDDSNFKAVKSSGTSMAGPQVAGVVACMLQSRKNWTPAKVRTWVQTVARTSRLSDTGGGYTDVQSLQSAPNRFLRQPFNRSVVYEVTTEVGYTNPAPVAFNVTNNGSGNYVFSGGVSGVNPMFTLTRGQRYVFNINAVGHPFWIKTTLTLGSVDAYYGVSNNGTDNGIITFVVPMDAPDELYYNCQYHTTMRGMIMIVS